MDVVIKKSTKIYLKKMLFHNNLKLVSKLRFYIVV